MSDRWAVVLALAVWGGAWASRPIPVLLAVAVCAVGLLARWPVLVVIGGGLLSSALGALAVAGVAPPTTSSTVEGEVELLGDPVDASGAVRVDVRIGRRRVEAWARGGPAASLRDRAAGERVTVRGRLRPPPEDVAPWLARRHVSARMDVDEVGPWRVGNVASRAANGLRRTLVDGAAPLDRDRRALFTGFVLGDVREQSVEVADDFRGAGLTHLLAVSGSNVAFVLLLASPLLSRLDLRGRWAATIALIGFFALVTRFEPSVLRASAMAAIACTAGTLGRPATSRRVLALAVALVVVVDPFIVRSVGFQLSVAASLGIITLARPVAAWLPGPRPVADLLGVTVAAQAGVAPVLVPVFGALPLSSIPANVLAVPAAGPLMAWGLTGGVVAGLLGPPFDRVLHLPTAAMTAWVGAVARWAAALPVGQVRAPQLLALVALTGLGLAGWRVRGVPAVVAIGASVVLLGPLVVPRASAHAGVEVARGARLWQRGGVVLVLDDPDASRLLDGLRRQGVRRVDVLVARRGSRPTATTVSILRSRVAVRSVVAPEGHAIRDAIVPSPGVPFHVGGLVVEATSVSPTLEVALWSTGGRAPDRGRPAAAVASAGDARRPRHHQPRPRLPGPGDGHPQPDARLVLRPWRVLGPGRLLPASRGVGGRGRRPPRRRWCEGRSGP